MDQGSNPYQPSLRHGSSLLGLSSLFFTPATLKMIASKDLLAGIGAGSRGASESQREEN